MMLAPQYHKLIFQFVVFIVFVSLTRTCNIWTIFCLYYLLSGDRGILSYVPTPRRMTGFFSEWLQLSPSGWTEKSSASSTKNDWGGNCISIGWKLCFFWFLKKKFWAILRNCVFSGFETPFLLLLESAQFFFPCTKTHETAFRSRIPFWNNPPEMAFISWNFTMVQIVKLNNSTIVQIVQLFKFVELMNLQFDNSTIWQCCFRNLDLNGQRHSCDSHMLLFGLKPPEIRGDPSIPWIFPFSHRKKCSVLHPWACDFYRPPG